MLILSISLGACGTLRGSPPREPVTRDIPGPPSYLQPVAKPPAREGVSAFVVSEQRGQVIDRQNTIIVSARKAWTGMKTTYQKSFLKRSIFGR